MTFIFEIMNLIHNQKLRISNWFTLNKRLLRIICYSGMVQISNCKVMLQI